VKGVEEVQNQTEEINMVELQKMENKLRESKEMKG